MNNKNRAKNIMLLGLYVFSMSSCGGSDIALTSVIEEFSKYAPVSGKAVILDKFDSKVIYADHAVNLPDVRIDLSNTFRRMPLYADDSLFFFYVCDVPSSNGDRLYKTDQFGRNPSFLTELNGSMFYVNCYDPSQIYIDGYQKTSNLLYSYSIAEGTFKMVSENSSYSDYCSNVLLKGKSPLLVKSGKRSISIKTSESGGTEEIDLSTIKSCPAGSYFLSAVTDKDYFVIADAEVKNNDIYILTDFYFEQGLDYMSTYVFAVFDYHFDTKSTDFLFYYENFGDYNSISIALAAI
jgi:hypothetical protein